MRISVCMQWSFNVCNGLGFIVRNYVLRKCECESCVCVYMDMRKKETRVSCVFALLPNLIIKVFYK